jgi:hypothetical protein
MLTEYTALTKTHTNKNVFRARDYIRSQHVLLADPAARMFAHCAHRASERERRAVVFASALSAWLPQTVLEYIVRGLPYRMAVLDLRGLRC